MKKVHIPLAIGIVMVLVTAGVTAVSRRERGAPLFSRGGAFAENDGEVRSKDAAAATTPAARRRHRRATKKKTAQVAAKPETTTEGARATQARRSSAPTSSRTQPVRLAGQPRDKRSSSDGSAPQPPASGTYTYAVNGWESATAFGRREYPERMTAVVHRDGVPASDVVIDLRFSEDHTERQIVRTARRGVALTFEGGSITFGPGSQTSEATYGPPLGQVPFPLRAQTSRSGTATARNSDGEVVRVEDWTARIRGRERLEVLGRQTLTWVVDIERQTREGSAEQLHRWRRYWYDPQRGTWVQWQEKFRGERDQGGFTFAYETQYSATLVGFDR